MVHTYIYILWLIYPNHGKIPPPVAVLVPEFSASAMSSLGATGSIKALPSANVKALALVRVANPLKNGCFNGKTIRKT